MLEQLVGLREIHDAPLEDNDMYEQASHKQCLQTMQH